MTTKTTHKKTNNKKKILIISTIVIAIGVVLLIVLLLGNKKQQQFKNYIKLQNGTKYSINVSLQNFLTNRTLDSETFDFIDLKKVYHEITKTNIREIHLTDLPNDYRQNRAPDNYLKYMCANMTNLEFADIRIPQSLTSTGEGFCRGMFKNCNSLQSLPSGFNLPQNLTDYVGDGFCWEMFYGCSTLSSLPLYFNLSNQIRSTGNRFCSEMFYGCSNLTMFPIRFNLPQNITTVDDYFCDQMFRDDSKLIGLPSGFNIPTGITAAGRRFCAEMFCDCSSLKNNYESSKTMTIHIPNLSGSNFYQNMFMNCNGLTGVPSTPTANSDISINIDQIV